MDSLADQLSKWQMNNQQLKQQSPDLSKADVGGYAVIPSDNDFSITLRLDTPLLQSGSVTKKVDPACQLRPPSVRGLLHTFVRALFGPVLNGDFNEVKKQEGRLLGSAGDEQGGGPTFRLEIESWANPLAWSGGFWIRPGDESKSKRKGHCADQITTVCFRPRPGVLDDDPKQPAMLWAAAWTAFSFGAIGNRSRRGYGALTVQKVDHAPPLSALIPTSGGVSPEFPTFPSPPASVDALGVELHNGLELALQVAESWLGVLRKQQPGPYPFFEIDTMQQVFLGQPLGRQDNGYAAMQKLMDACSQAVGARGSEQEALFHRSIGSAANPRLASPLWVRLYKLRDESYVPVVTFSPASADESLAHEILKKIGALDSSTKKWRTLDTF